MKQQIVLVEFDNCSPFVYKFVSRKEIKLEDVVRYFESTEGFNPDRDSITFVDKLSEINLDEELLNLSEESQDVLDEDDGHHFFS